VIRAVFDANVLASWFAAEDGTLFELFERWKEDKFQLIVSEYILEEVRDAWRIPYWREHMTLARIQEATELLRDFAEFTQTKVVVRGVASHDEDDLVLSTAVSAQADYLVTGDKQLRMIAFYEGVRILSPREFLSILEQVEREGETAN
jgi:uncharacterized protein